MVDPLIHVKIEELYKNAETPKLVCRDPAPDRLVMQYFSDRKLCQFMEGILEGVGDYYKSTIQYQQTRCTLDGADFCEFDLTFSNKKNLWQKLKSGQFLV